MTWPYMVTYVPYLFALLALLELFLLREYCCVRRTMLFSTNVQECNDITSCYPEGSHYCQHPGLSLHSTMLGVIRTEPPHTHVRSPTTCSVAEVTSSAPPPPAHTVGYERTSKLKNVGGTHSYNLSLFNNVADERVQPRSQLNPPLH